MEFDNFTAKVGERYATPDGTVLVVWNITEAGSMGRSHASGPLVWLHCRPGGYSMTADAHSATPRLTRVP